MHPPDPQMQRPPARAVAGETNALVKARAKDRAAAVWTSSSPRRCPWFAEVIERAARPGAWHATAIVYAGATAWERAQESHEAGRRACTLLVPGVPPATVRWPSVANWIGDTGDLPTAQSIELARCLIDSGAELVQLVGDHIRPSLTMRRASHAA